MLIQHTELAAGRWLTLSLAEQLGNIGSEVSRAARQKDNDGALFWGAVERGLELFDLTLDDSRWNGRRSEIARAREVFCDAVYGGKQYHASLSDLVPYFNYFALIARSNIEEE